MNVFQAIAASWTSLYLRNRLFQVLAVLVLLFALSFVWLFFFTLARIALALVVALVFVDVLMLYFFSGRMVAERELPRVFSLGDEQEVHIRIQHNAGQNWAVQVLDELPYQLQIRDFSRELNVAPHITSVLTYKVKPLRRGVYRFGFTYLFLRTPLSLVERRMRFSQPSEVPVYPSIIQMHQYDLLATASTSRGLGLRRIRRIGHSYEFEQIKTYVAGDDRRAINWKATSRRNGLMVNHYEDERSQHIYCAIDTGRSMKLPFDGMSLMDYAVNASLALSAVAIRKHDRCGLVCFDRRIHTTLPAGRRALQIQRILEALYRQEESAREADFEGFYQAYQRLSPARSLLILFSNFESDYALQRALPVLRRLQRRHVLLLVLFENTELVAAASQPSADIPGIYRRTLAAGFLHQKKQMALRAAQAGIQTVLTRPADLTAKTINKYLELKSRGMI